MTSMPGPLLTPDPPPEPRPWGFWATLGFSVILGIVFVGTQMAVALSFIAAGRLLEPEIGIETLARDLQTNGLVLSVAFLVSLPPCVGLAALFAWLRPGITVRQYLALRVPSWRELLVWTGVLVGLMVASDLLAVSLDRPVVPDVMREMVRTAGWAPLLWLTVVAAAPVLEETLFRGFLYAGLSRSFVGPVGAVLITSALWAAIHTQYEWVGRAVIFTVGLVLGAARARTRSLLVPLVLHVVQNVAAMTQTALAVRFGW